MFTFGNVMHERKKETEIKKKEKKQCKQFLESAQNGLEVIFKSFVIRGVFTAFIFEAMELHG